MKNVLIINGTKQMKTYAVHDIFKGDLNLENELLVFEETLKQNFL